MKNYIVGAIIGGLVMLSGGMAYAATKGTSGLSVVDRLETGSTDVIKVYDQDASVICYLTENNTWGDVSTGISCLHH